MQTINIRLYEMDKNGQPHAVNANTLALSTYYKLVPKENQAEVLQQIADLHRGGKKAYSALLIDLYKQHEQQVKEKNPKAASVTEDVIALLAIERDIVAAQNKKHGAVLEAPKYYSTLRERGMDAAESAYDAANDKMENAKKQAEKAKREAEKEAKEQEKTDKLAATKAKAQAAKDAEAKRIANLTPYGRALEVVIKDEKKRAQVKQIINTELKVKDEFTGKDQTFEQIEMLIDNKIDNLAFNQSTQEQLYRLAKKVLQKEQDIIVERKNAVPVAPAQAGNLPYYNPIPSFLTPEKKTPILAVPATPPQVPQEIKKTETVKKEESHETEAPKEKKQAETAQKPAPRKITGDAYTIQSGDTLLQVSKGAPDLLSKVKAEMGDGTDSRSAELALMLIIARKNDICNVDDVKAGQKLAMPTADEIALGVAYMKAGGKVLQDCKITYTGEIKGKDIDNLVSLAPNAKPPETVVTTRTAP